MRSAHPQNETQITDGDHSYMTSAADLMVGLLFVFIIMVAFLAVQIRTEAQARTVAETAAREAEARALAVARAELKNLPPNTDPRGIVTYLIGEKMKAVLPSITVNPSSGVITLPETLLFALGSSTLKVEARDQLRKTSAILIDVLRCYVANQRVGRACPMNPEGHEIETIFIEGHTDSIPMNRPGGNIKLSLDRAISVDDVLVQNTGLVNYKNLANQEIFSYSAYADKRPLIAADSTDARNRRVDLRIVLAYQATDAKRLLSVIREHSPRP